ncbi:Bug family tripartite tricarboxylate transporter substrate binding protein [Pseudorhodoplanes sp.]|jgi:tripartite-type tricarboxylate transporter receptor subunit TctC|uniref:Bug family tripartite tricarboxylate transporter substrate binding protein n=1 Tax=Pseudorhodoplanes sp. TaxID=1934341 RepID=UPI002CA05C11|nr:tripartite tricarboxylate transporter substrate-binding protein [Pseudorhodoplanes sp.]HWV40757.1 tripartite tricarboxylate transporter substrate-binding protein [Pseudorhodoplanes sp.]
MLRLLFAAIGAAMLISGAHAQNYPSRPITLVVPLGLGGSTDVIARIMAESMRNILGTTIVVENTTGAGGTIGVGRVARSAPDGYTLGIGQWGTNVASGAIYPLQFDLQNDFEPVGLISTQPFLIVARKTMPANNLKELVAWLKANQDKASQGNSGVGTPSHVAGLMFQNVIGAKYTMVPYRGAGQSMQDLVAGQLDVMLDTPAVSLPQITAGNIKPYAVTAKSRIPVAPDVPTTDEAGLPGFYFSFWHAFWVPKGTPKEIVAKLNDALVKALADPVTRERLTKIAQEIFPVEQQTPQALAAFHKAEIDKWWPIIKEAGIKPQ